MKMIMPYRTNAKCLETVRSLEYHKNLSFHTDLSQEHSSEFFYVREMINVFFKLSSAYITQACNKHSFKFCIY